MTALREQTISMLRQVPENKVAYVMRILQGILSSEKVEMDSNQPTRSQLAYQRLQKFRKQSAEDFDYKEELSRALGEKYEDIN